jgi:hypothetical protein
MTRHSKTLHLVSNPCKRCPTSLNKKVLINDDKEYNKVQIIKTKPD